MPHHFRPWITAIRWIYHSAVGRARVELYVRTLFAMKIFRATIECVEFGSLKVVAWMWFSLYIWRAIAYYSPIVGCGGFLHQNGANVFTRAWCPTTHEGILFSIFWSCGAHDEEDTHIYRDPLSDKIFFFFSPPMLLQRRNQKHVQNMDDMRRGASLGADILCLISSLKTVIICFVLMGFGPKYVPRKGSRF